MGDQGQELPWSELRLVGVLAGFGSLGGFVSWIYAVTIGEPLPLDMPGAIAASVAVGAFAGVIGVLLLANIDSTKAFTRTVAIALLTDPLISEGQVLEIPDRGDHAAAS